MKPGTAMLRHESLRGTAGAGFMAEDHSSKWKLKDQEMPLNLCLLCSRLPLREKMKMSSSSPSWSTT